MSYNGKIDTYLNEEGLIQSTSDESLEVIAQEKSTAFAEEVRRALCKEGKYEDKDERYRMKAQKIGNTGLTVYDITKRWLRKGTLRLLEHCVSNGIITPGTRVLDVCCGTGLESTFFAEVVGDNGFVTGVDKEPGMITAAQKRAARRGLSNIEFLTGDCDDLPLNNQDYGTVTCFLALTEGHAEMNIEDPCAPTIFRNRLAHFRSFVKNNGKYVITASSHGNEDLHEDLRYHLQRLISQSLQGLVDSDPEIKTIEASEKRVTDGTDIWANFHIVYGEFA